MAYLMLGDIYIAQQLISEAVKVLRQHIFLAPSNPDGYFRLGYAYSLAGDYNNALLNFQRVLEMHPYDKDAENNIEILRAMRERGEI